MRQTRIRTIVMVLATASQVTADETSKPTGLPVDAVSAERQCVAVVQRAEKEYSDKVTAARANYVKRLEEIVTAETRKGNLDGALATRAELMKARDAGPVAPADVAAGDPFLGRWQMRPFHTTGTWVHQFTQKGMTKGDDLVIATTRRDGQSLHTRNSRSSRGTGGVGTI